MAMALLPSNPQTGEFPGVDEPVSSPVSLLGKPLGHPGKFGKPAEPMSDLLHSVLIYQGCLVSCNFSCYGISNDEIRFLRAKAYGLPPVYGCPFMSRQFAKCT